MLKPIITSLIICLCLIGQGQVLTFNSMNAKKLDWFIRTACADSSGNIYIGGDFKKIDTVPYWGVAKWNGTQWDSLSSAMHGQTQGGSYSIRTLAFYKNHIYAGGGFNTMQGKPIRYIARWDGTNWDSLPQSPNSGVDKLVVCNGKLYALGYFNKIGSMSCNSIAVWDGIAWQPLTFPFNNYGLADITEYQGELYIGGNIFNGPLPGGLVKFDGISWSVVGQGIKGNVASVNALKVFNNELYVGGWIEKAAGNAGDFLIKWDGANYKEVITGLDGQIWNFTEIPDGLIATGCFSTPFNYVLKISNDGICGYNASFDNCVQSTIYSNNKLYYYGNFWSVNADSTMANICYTNYTTQADSCVDFLSSIKEDDLLSSIKVFPNPTNSIINILDEYNELQNASIQIKDYLGQVIYSNSFTTQINLHDLSAGIYFLTIQNGYNKKTIKIIKQ